MTVWPAGTGRLVLATVDSTNAEAARRAEAGEAGPLWIMAVEQTAARGRRGRRWSGEPGNLFATLLVRPNLSPRDAALVSFVAALAVADVAEAAAPEAEIRLKWPNDVLVNGGKVAGILLESAGIAEQLHWLAVGIGVNLVGAPGDAEIRPGGTPPISLTAAGAAPMRPETALSHLAEAMARWLARFESHGFEPIRSAWLARAAHLGQRIGAGLPTEQLWGTFEAVDDRGNLVLNTASGRRLIAAAEIHFPE
ncbi:MAG: biotin--[acetyl-CoA-carboxylase] ligase [Pseudomonadota bacterium]